MRKPGAAIAIVMEPSPPLHINATVMGEHAQSHAEIELQQIASAQQNLHQFAPLYSAYVDKIWRFAMSRLGDPDRAADATSQVFVKAMQSLPEFRPKRVGDVTSFPSWLMMIARNTIVDDQRRQRPSMDIDDPGIAHVLTNGHTPEHHALRREEQQLVRAAVARLNPRQRQIVELRAAGYSGKEIADMLGMSLNGVRTAHSRAYARLRDLLADTTSSQENTR